MLKGKSPFTSQPLPPPPPPTPRSQYFVKYVPVWILIGEWLWSSRDGLERRRHRRRQRRRRRVESSLIPFPRATWKGHQPNSIHTQTLNQIGRKENLFTLPSSSFSLDAFEHLYRHLGRRSGGLSILLIQKCMNQEGNKLDAFLSAIYISIQFFMHLCMIYLINQRTSPIGQRYVLLGISSYWNILNISWI